MTDRTKELRTTLEAVIALRTRESKRVGTVFMKHQHNDSFLRTGRPL